MNLCSPERSLPHGEAQCYVELRSCLERGTVLALMYGSATLSITYSEDSMLLVPLICEIWVDRTSSWRIMVQMLRSYSQVAHTKITIVEPIKGNEC